MTPNVKGFFDPNTFTITYIVSDPETRHCAIIDSVLDYDPKSGRTSTKSADEVIAFVEQELLTVDWILETHAHADHLTAANYLKEKLGGQTGIGAQIGVVQKTFQHLFNIEADFPTDGSQFDHLFQDGEVWKVGNLIGTIMATPGHTPACITYLLEDTAFVGDTLFMPDYGTARVDFPGGSAATLYDSIRQLFNLPPETRLFMCHDYLPEGRKVYQWETTVAEERANNVHIQEGITAEEFIRFRTERDKNLEVPNLIFPSLQVNMRAGQLPPPEGNGIRYLKIPLNVL
ncbi:MAG: MBL fold metallo-hydrolase [Microcystaceae cyanobacterium]|nr:MBL fold metallo-hydrolase [Merismopediaceae bacterium]